MGQKVNANGLRYGVNKEWQSRWNYQNDEITSLWLVEDDKIRKLLISKYAPAFINNIEIERRKIDDISLFIYATQPGLLIGNGGAEIKNVKDLIQTIVSKKTKIKIEIIAISNPNVYARVIAREIANSIEKRISFRTAQKLAMKKVMASGALGIKTHVSGRLGGVEMARAEGYSKGNVPLSTFRADIDYALEEAHTTYGIIGVKVWINRGVIFKRGQISEVCKRTVSPFDSRGPRKPNFNAKNKTANRESNADKNKNSTTEKVTK